MSIFETLDQLNKRKEPSYIYLDETDNKIKEKPLSLDSVGAANYIKPNDAKLIHDFIFL